VEKVSVVLIWDVVSSVVVGVSIRSWDPSPSFFSSVEKVSVVLIWDVFSSVEKVSVVLVMFVVVWIVWSNGRLISKSVTMN
jgi:hypothetical protein